MILFTFLFLLRNSKKIFLSIHSIAFFSCLLLLLFACVVMARQSASGQWCPNEACDDVCVVLLVQSDIALLSN